MPTNLPRPPIASASSILARIVSVPMLMRPDLLGSWVRELAGGRTPENARQGMAAVCSDDDYEYLPWEAPMYEVANGIALVEVSGPIVNGYDAVTCWYWGMMSSERLQAACLELAADPAVKTVIFRFGSPGGMAQGTPETGAMIAQLGTTKLTLGFTSSQCCSAAYWLASQCRLMFSTLSADVGCIGTYLAFYDLTEYFAKEGIKLELFARGTYKAMGIPGKPLTDEQRAWLDADITRINDRFLSTVRAARAGVSDESMQGQTFDGDQAIVAKLIDAVVASFPALLEQISVEHQLLPAAAAV